ncbi:hypothetical protein [Actinoplanes flavus]|uniref:DUF5666 domain-containing protein n=1 Tax=Actinoplanes flavus TaxID=2820290 RepID=A0ABS3UQZ1_9ACTN|nr:hypothetical protein [Actinoplanes flavus]MBO3741199.1 hypothetical protein [Actinoplanes flavus]
MTSYDTEALPRRRWWNRTTIGLLGAVLLAGGFLAGVQAHDRWGGPAVFPPDAVRPGGDAGGHPAARPLPAGGTTGIVQLVDGDMLYVTTADGETVTVRAGDTTVKVSRTTGLETLTSGLPVTVEGAADSEGVITATSITAG